jgi:single-strand DNA-binding protein
MYNLNRVQLIGHLGADPELRYTGQGQPVANFNLATNSTWKDRNGEQQSNTNWARIVAWDKKAEMCREHLKKGSYVYIEGRLQTRSWEDREGTKRYITEVVATTIGFLEKKNEQGSAYEPPDVPPPSGEDDYDDDVPF